MSKRLFAPREMNVLSEDPYWRVRHGLLESYPTLREDLSCDVVVIGAGISGALIAESMSRAGKKVIVVDRYDIAAGSTSGSTALLQYDFDLSVADLSQKIGRESALTAYRTSFRIMDRIREISEEIGHSQYRTRKSVYLASTKSDARKLRAEVDLRNKAGFPSRFIEEEEISERFTFSRPGACESSNAAEIDPYLFTHELFRYLLNKGVQIFDRSRLEHFKSNDGIVTAHFVSELKKEYVIRAKHLVLATGYETAKYLPKKRVKLHSSYALISKPFEKSVWNSLKWPDHCLLWETKRPYPYLRTTLDRRIIIGGLDEPFYNPEKRDAKIGKKMLELEKMFKDYFPGLPFFPAYTWAGTFAETEDSMPYIGELPKLPQCYFACGFGGNGITFSAIAGELIRDAILGQENAAAELFGLERRT